MFSRSASLVALLTIAFGAGCAGAPPPAAKAPVATGPAPEAPAPTSTAAPSASPTASNVNISDEIRAKCGIPSEDAYFPFDSARVTANDRFPLDSVARCFVSGPLKGHPLKLVGRTDPRGEMEYNMTLGLSRADSVCRYLVGRGIASSKAKTTSRGAMDATGTDEATWQNDRRVDLMLGD
jgi:peptidoglycan-associated lipoprotein